MRFSCRSLLPIRPGPQHTCPHTWRLDRGQGHQRTAVATALTPLLLVTLPCPSRSLRDFSFDGPSCLPPSSTLLLSAAPPWRGSASPPRLQGRGGEEGGKSEIVPQTGKVRSEKGQKQGRPRLRLHQVGLFGIRP